jgi:hypothetical protein
MSLAAKALFTLALIFLLLSLGLDYAPMREAPDLDRFQRYSGTDPWAIAGIRPGDTLAQHRRRLGPPVKDTDMKSVSVLGWSRPEELSLTVSPEGEVVDVWGRSVTAGGNTLVYTGLSQAEVERILGRGKVLRSTRPTGSGVISLGSTEVGRILTYENGGVRFEVTLEENQVKHVRAVKTTSGK